MCNVARLQRHSGLWRIVRLREEFYWKKMNSNITHPMKVRLNSQHCSFVAIIIIINVYEVQYNTPDER